MTGDKLGVTILLLGFLTGVITALVILSVVFLGVGQ